jgi:hypothetical protein
MVALVPGLVVSLQPSRDSVRPILWDVPIASIELLDEPAYEPSVPPSLPRPFTACGDSLGSRSKALE